ENMGAQEYSIPTRPDQVIADFYLIQILKSADRYVPSHKQELLDYELKEVENTLVPALKDNVLRALGYSILCESRHIFDRTSIESESMGMGEDDFEDQVERLPYLKSL